MISSLLYTLAFNPLTSSIDSISKLLQIHPLLSIHTSTDMVSSDKFYISTCLVYAAQLFGQILKFNTFLCRHYVVKIYNQLTFIKGYYS